MVKLSLEPEQKYCSCSPAAKDTETHDVELFDVQVEGDKKLF